MAEAATAHQFGAQPQNFLFQKVRARRLMDDVLDLFRVERFFKEAVSPATHGFERSLLGLAARDDDDGNAGTHPARRFNHGQPLANVVKRGRQTQVA
jgi:hypothetical protein